MDAKTGELVAGGVKEQAAQCLSHIKAIVGGKTSHKMDDVVKVNVFVKNIDDMAAVDEAYVTFFPGYVPARRTVGVANLPKGASSRSTPVSTPKAPRRKGLSRIGQVTVMVAC